MQNPDSKHGSRHPLAAPLWTMAVALWVIALAVVLGAVKVAQGQQDVQKQIERLRKWPF